MRKMMSFFEGWAELLMGVLLFPFMVLQAFFLLPPSIIMAILSRSPRPPVVFE